MEVSALRYSGAIGLHGRTPLLRLQSDERLISLIRRGNTSAFEVLVSRYHTRLLAFCRHLLGSREDAEDILQEVFAAAFNAILADDRPINVRPWLYRIARNRSLNHLRRIQAIGVDSMDVHFSENGASTADKVHDREQFQLLVGDIQGLPETQRTALVLREMDALSYEQIAEAMDTTVPGVKSLLVRARISLAEAAEARLLSCEDVRIELAEVAEGLRKRPGALVRRHLNSCRRCKSFQGQLKQTNRALAAVLPIGPLALLRQLAVIHLGHSAGTSTGATAAGATGAGAGASATGAAGQAAAVASTAGGGAALGGAGGVISAGAGAIATKAAGALAAAAIVTAGAVEATHTVHRVSRPTASVQPMQTAPVVAPAAIRQLAPDVHLIAKRQRTVKSKLVASKASDKSSARTLAKAASASTSTSSTTKTSPSHDATKPAAPGRVQTQTDPTVLASPGGTSAGGTTGATGPSGASAGDSAAPASGSGGTTGPTGPAGAGPTGSTAPASAPPPNILGGENPAGTAGPTGPDGAAATDANPPATDPSASARRPPATIS